MPTLSIIIVSYNVRTELERCLQSLFASPPRVTHEVFVIDNASADGTADAVRRAWPEVRVIEAPGNVGFAASSNIGIRASAGELLLLLNPDTVIPIGAIDKLVEVMRRRADVAVVGPRLVDEAGRTELSFGSMIGPFTELRRRTVGRLYARGVEPVRRHVETRTRQERFTDWVTGACLLVRRQAAEAAGLLDERFFLYNEDVDLCAAIRTQGYKVLFTPEVEVVHLRGRSVASAPEVVARAIQQSRLAFYAKHHPGWLPFLKAYLWLRGKLPP